MSDKARPETLRELVQEILDNPPMEGVCCVFCLADWSNARAYVGKPAIEHSDDCWLNRARTAMHAPNPLLAACKALLEHEGERQCDGIGLEHDSDALEAAKEAARAAIEDAEQES